MMPILLTLCLPGDIGVPVLQYTSFTSAVNFLEYFTYLIVSNKLVKFNMEIKFNNFLVFYSLKVALSKIFVFPMVMLHH